MNALKPIVKASLSLLAIFFIALAAMSINRAFRENQKNAQIDRQRQRLEYLMHNPSEILVVAKQVNDPPEAVRRMEYKQADYVDDMAERLMNVTDGRDTKTEIIA